MEQQEQVKTYMAERQVKTYTAQQALVADWRCGEDHGRGTWVRVDGEWRFDCEGTAAWLDEQDDSVNEELVTSFVMDPEVD